MKLGILVVYLAPDGTGWVLEKHLRHLAQTRRFMDFRVYAAANRLTEKYQPLLCSYDFVQVVDLPHLSERESEEHGRYLDLLAARAISDGCDYLCTFDVDSWPIRDDWIELAYNQLVENEAAAVAILRAENRDRVLPHPSFSFLEAGLFKDPICRYWVPRSEITQPYLEFLQNHRQRGDTGAGIGFFLEKAGLRWVKLRRSNKFNYHYLMGGIYGNYIFHLGASNRENRMLFRGDEFHSVAKITEPIAALPNLGKVRLWMLKWLMRVCEGRNRRKFARIAARLKDDEEGFYQKLLKTK